MINSAEFDGGYKLSRFSRVFFFYCPPCAVDDAAFNDRTNYKERAINESSSSVDTVNKHRTGFQTSYSGVFITQFTYTPSTYQGRTTKNNYIS